VSNQPLRYEVKMVCSETYLDAVRMWTRLHPAAFFEAYPPRQVNSLYFDSFEVGAFNDNLDGISQRNKLRLRWYGPDLSHVRDGRLELKSRHGYLGTKAYYPLAEALDFGRLSWLEIGQRLRAQVGMPFRPWLEQFPHPYLVTSYQREYYETMDRSVRMTIDYNLFTYEQWLYTSPNLTLSSPLAAVVVEVKAPREHYRRVSDILSSIPLRVSKNSKYVSGILQNLSAL